MIASPAGLVLVGFIFVSTAIVCTEATKSRPGIKPFGPKACASTRYNANFDDRDWLPGQYVANTIGTYEELAWQGFAGFNANTTTATSTSLAPLVLESYPNAVGTGFELTLLSPQIPQFSTIYSNSPAVGGFNLHSFYFSCVENLGTEFTAYATPCEFTVQAFKDGKQVSQKKLTYKPKMLIRSPMALATFASPDFCNIDTVKFLVPKQLTKAILIDNVDYTTHTCKKAGSKRSLMSPKPLDQDEELLPRRVVI
ncbi:hypothetical protein IE81DRAFT_160005 [Ceraceosorus guamensis]|uniref:Uncharacterized protein n=1 Tax=Ceraceosorus guamensis TaxID=1522189 RepID=A0A316VW25_9BASI|nr:hypothetical protein IE81DRAFT_160005 [Ceraceosorus guamensis]PWN41669.1 hypothetical protein IE81DRAFT_160005 [Ceraceosorus guamensis]